MGVLAYVAAMEIGRRKTTKYQQGEPKSSTVGHIES